MRGRRQFHLDQAKIRTRQRLSEGRAKPVDVIVQTLYFPDDFEAEAGADPYTVMRGLTLAELRDLRADVEDYQVACPARAREEIYCCRRMSIRIQQHPRRNPSCSGHLTQALPLFLAGAHTSVHRGRM